MEQKTIVYIKVNEIYPHPDNPRKEIGNVSELAESIKQNGIMQNLTVVKGHGGADDGYTALIGHRRLAAAKLAGVKEVPCVIVDMDMQEQIGTMMLENLMRSDLTMIEQAKGFQMMLDLGDTINSISEKTGFSQTTVRRRIRLNEYGDAALKKVAGRQFSFEDIDRLAKIKDDKAREKVFKEIGTSNFEYEYQKAIRVQTESENALGWKRIFDEYGFKEIQYGLAFSSKYECIKDKYGLVNYVTGKPQEEKVKQIAEAYTGEQLYYAKSTYGDTYYLRIEAKETDEQAEQRRREEQLAAQLKMRKKAIEDISQAAFKTRLEFVKNYPLSDCKKNIAYIVCQIAKSECKTCLSRNYISYEDKLRKARVLSELYNIDNDKWDREIPNEVMPIIGTYVQKRQEKALLIQAYAMLGDSNVAPIDYNGHFFENEEIKAVYEFLGNLGYEMTDEEKAVMTGTSEYYLGS